MILRRGALHNRPASGTEPAAAQSADSPHALHVNEGRSGPLTSAPPRAICRLPAASQCLGTHAEQLFGLISAAPAIFLAKFVSILAIGFWEK
jgi:hypothetical protein